MNTRMNFVVALLLVVALALGSFIGVTAGTYLFDLVYPTAQESDHQNDSTSESQTSDQPTSSVVDQTPKKKIALTFDDGPHSVYTNEILDLLEQYNAKATFFVYGEKLNSNTGKALKRAITLGCEIGNHTFSHPEMTELSAEDVVSEIRRTNEKIALYSDTNYQCKIYRPPYGSINRATMQALYQSGLRMYSIHWSSDSLDWEYQKRYATEQEITREEAVQGAFDTIVSQTGDGTVILMHDVHEITPDVLRLVLEKYTAEGYTFVTVSELFDLKDNAPEEAYFNRYRSTSSILATTK
jgi:peptidoglycan/xylan/chitin deacetylase (PgdA/CDA1 family)